MSDQDEKPRIRLVSGGGPGDDGRGIGGGDGGGDGPARAITFADVGGLEEVKERIRMRVIHPLRRPELFATYGRKAGGGLLLYGPPGCGKTYLARATAGEAGLGFHSVGVDDVLDMWLGQSEKRLAELFQAARAEAPCVLFFDEVDALGARRAALRHESYRTLVTQLLAELDGAGRPSRDGVLVVAATNAPWDVDPAFRRPGRFGEAVFVPPPDLAARVEILSLCLRDRPHDEIDLVDVAGRAELFSGADLRALVDEATDVVLAEALRGDGKSAPRRVTGADLLAALGRMKPSTREWFATAARFATWSNDGGQYDELAEYIRSHRLD